MNLKYSASFTAASLEVKETRQCAVAYVNNNYGWEGITAVQIQSSVLEKVNPKTVSRKFSEFKKRISHLSNEQINLLATGSYEDAVNISFLSCVKAYLLLRDYCLEVLSQKITSFDRKATLYELNQFIQSKSLSHPELAKMTPLTLAKVQQVIRRILVQANLLINEEPQSNVISSELKVLLAEEDEHILRAMLIEPAMIKSIKGLKI